MTQPPVLPNADPSRPPGRRSKRLLLGTCFALLWVVAMVALFYAVENWRGARAQAEYLREAKARGERLDREAFVPARVPDDQNFAMTPFLAPLFDYKRPVAPGENHFQYRDPDGSQRAQKFGGHLPQINLKGGWRLGRRLDLLEVQASFDKVHAGPAPENPQQAATAILAVLQEFSSVLDELRAAASRPHSRFNFAYDNEDPWSILLPHLAVLKKACQILALRASAELALNQPEPALEDLLLVLHLADTAKDEPFLISFLVRVADLQIAIQVVWEGLADRKWSAAQLQTLQSHLEHTDLLTELRRGLGAERMWGNLTVDMLRAKRSLLTSLAGEDPNTGWKEQTWENYAFRCAPGGWLDQEKVNYNRLFDSLVLPALDVANRQVHPRVADENSHTIEAALQHQGSLLLQHKVIAKLLLPAIGSTLQKGAQAQTMLDQAALACALERHHLAHGNYPGTLDALSPQFIQRLPHDAISGEPLKYHRTDSGHFTLYSVGWNETDDGGEAEVAGGNSHVQDLRQGDWVWRY